MLKPIHLDYFETEINPTILKKGHGYFKKSAVLGIVETDAGRFNAKVQGSRVYLIDYRIKNNCLEEHVCNCDYVSGPVCKHIAALLFYIMQDALGIAPRTSAKRKTLDESMDDDAESEMEVKQASPMEKKISLLLNKMNSEDLAEILLRIALANKTVRDDLITNYAYLIGDNSVQSYMKIMTPWFSSAKRQGFITYYSSYDLARKLNGLNKLAERAFNNGELDTALRLSLALVAKIVPAYNQMDDSSGRVGDVERSSTERIYSMLNSGLQDDLRTELWDFCMSHVKKNTFQGWDWDAHGINILVDLSSNLKEMKQILQLLDSIERSPLFHEDIQVSKYNLYKKFGFIEEYKSIRLNNFNYPRFQHYYLDELIENEDFDSALAFLEESLAIDSESNYQLSFWMKYLKKIGELLDDMAMQERAIRWLMIHSDEMEMYFGLYSQLIPQSKWQETMDQIIGDLQLNEFRDKVNRIALLLYLDNRTEQLFDFFQKNQGKIDTPLQMKIAKLFPDLNLKKELNDIRVSIGMRSYTTYYEYVCEVLRKWLKLGFRAEVLAFISELRNSYPNRLALQNQLDQV
jgi:hypothetical protein